MPEAFSVFLVTFARWFSQRVLSTRNTEPDNVFYTNKSNKVTAYFTTPVFSLSMPHVAGMLMWAVYSGTDVISSLEKEEVRYV
ncbi:hypothetical protein DEH81_14665 [Pectobacterium zantedeschiae]|uniref:Uncharacterized protein n=1 Tax=Pectobacterium zantedeschiae TaxID=2034769 RepID=A0A9X8P468_9GAMM|nr:hypothetical protein DEH81_14665 [Pectobacterium zantedeschiae]RYC41534.1 hypothetical protein CLR69_15515 [Pectobacterium zantedeschiae]RYC46644.1 hypothetical protein CTN06_09935 [Pectobacterium zantedeschiae]